MSLTQAAPGTVPSRARPPWAKKLRLLHAYIRRRPIWCCWQVTYDCNFRCGHCHYWKDRTPADQLLTGQDFQKGGARLAEMGSLLISLAGGEPLLRPDLPEIVETLARWHFPLLATNGWHMDARTARRLWQAGLYGASVSIDYADPQQHDRRRGMPGAFNRAVQAVRHLTQQRVHPWQRVSIMCVLMHDNLDQVETLLELARQNGAYLVVQPYCTLKTGDARFCAPSGVAARLLRLRRRHPNFLSSYAFLSRFDRAGQGGVPGCRAGRAFFNIDHRGHVAVCVERRHQPVGRITDMDANALRRRLRRASAGNRCQACWYNCRGEVEAIYTPGGLLRSLPFVLDGWASRSAGNGSPAT